MLRQKDRNKLWIPCMECDNIFVLQEAGVREAGRHAFPCGRCGEICVKEKHIKP